MSVYEYDNIVIEGGGMKNMACLGAYKYLEERGHVKHLEKFIGSSVGSMIALLFLIGYTADQVFNMILTTNFQDYMISNPIYYPYNLFFKYGLNDGNKMTKLLGQWMEKKYIHADITFLQLYEQTQKVLIVTGTNITKRMTVYFQYETHPNMKVLDAIRASINIPLFFTSVVIDGDYYVDGGLLVNFPLYYFDTEDTLPTTSITLPKQTPDTLTKSPAKTIGLLTMDANTNENHASYYGIQSIHNLLEYIISTGYTVFQAIEKNYIKHDYWNRTISILLPKEVKLTEFSLSHDTMYELFNTGYSSAYQFFINSAESP